MTTYPIYCSGCQVVGLGFVDLADDADPATIIAATVGLLCATCAAAYVQQLNAGKIRAGQVPPGLDKRPRLPKPPTPTPPKGKP